METLTLRLPKKMHELMEDLASILSLNKTQLARKLLLENLKKEAFKTAIELYQKREISLLKASKLAGMHIIEFLNYLPEEKELVEKIENLIEENKKISQELKDKEYKK